MIFLRDSCHQTMLLTSIDVCDVTTSRSKSIYSAAEISVESSLTKTNFLCVRFMEDNYGSNVHAELEKSVRFMECPLWRGFVIRDSLGIRPGQNFLSVLERFPL